ncbi:MAG: energy-coupling factor transporter ATPase [Clostridia bacterium]|nr:energy-coupling factor transporter ATPase [Clostridia bacterium]
MAILSLDKVSFSYDKKKNVLENLSLEVSAGEYIAVIGRNGSGKSTLAKLFNGLIKPDCGEIFVDGLSSADKKNEFEIRKRVGVVFQNPDNQLVASIVEDDIAFGPENLGINREEIGERIEFALSAVGMQKFRHSSPSRISGGQKQRIAIAGVLALKPQILVLDESTAMLDPQGREEVLAVVKKLNHENGVTVITITHYMEEVIEADSVIVLIVGNVALSGTPEEIFNQKDKLSELGLELTVTSLIKEKLEKHGVKISGNPLGESALGEELCKLASKI